MRDVALPVGIDDVLAAARRLRGIANRTPVVTSRTLDALCGASVFLKCENLQRMGAFKFRGAFNRLAQLAPEARAAGVVAFSSGNHAQGVALAARLLGIEATIVMPHDAPAAKVTATRGYGAEIVTYERGRENREVVAAELASERGATLVPPFDDAAVIAGQGTAALELFEEVRDLDAVIVPLGGGGLLAGTAVVARSAGDAIDIWGVEPEAGDDFRQSLDAGHPVRITVPVTIADALRTERPGDLTFRIADALHARVATVSDADLCRAVRFAFERLKLVVEPSGAAGLAAVLAGKIELAGRRAGVILSGGNVDAATFQEALELGS